MDTKSEILTHMVYQLIQLVFHRLQSVFHGLQTVFLGRQPNPASTELKQPAQALVHRAKQPAHLRK